MDYHNCGNISWGHRTFNVWISSLDMSVWINDDNDPNAAKFLTGQKMSSFNDNRAKEISLQWLRDSGAFGE